MKFIARFLLLAVLAAMPAYAATVGFSMYPQKAQYFGANGNPLTSGTVTVYNTGTLNLATIYSDQTVATPIANPITLNARGEPPTAVFLPNGTVVDVVLKDSLGATIYTVSRYGYEISQSTVASALWPRTAEEVSAGITPASYAYVPGHIYRYGAVAGGSSSANRTAIQNAINSTHGVFVPNGTFDINASIDLLDETTITCESRDSVIKGALTAPLLRGKNGTTERRYNVRILGCTLDNTSTANAGGIGLDFLSMTAAKIYGTLIKNVETGVRQGGSGSLAAYYNEFHGVDISTCVTGYNNGTLGNENKVFGGRVNDCTTGTRDNDCSGNAYFGLAVEVFTTGHQNSNTASATNIRYIASRLENVPTTGTGFSIGATAQVTSIIAPQFTGLTTPISDSATDTSVTSADQWFQVSGGTRVKKHLRVVVTKDIASLAATTARGESFTVTGVIAGDSVFVTLPSGLTDSLIVRAPQVTGANAAQLSLYNPTGSAIDPPSLDFTFDIWRH